MHLEKSPTTFLCNVAFFCVIGTLFIFINHIWAYLPFGIPDFGRRGVEIFILSSGFLLAFDHIDRESKKCTLLNNFRYALEKIKKIYPLHFLTFFACAILIYKGYLNSCLTKDGYITSVLLNTTLLQSWSGSSDVYWGFNGVSWFLSSIIFCWFCFPLIISFIKRLQPNLFQCFFMSVLILFSLTICQKYLPINKDYYFYIFPAYNLALFYIACLFGAYCKRISIYMVTPKSVAGHKLIILMLIFYCVSVVLCNNVWPKDVFIGLTILLLCMCVCSSDKAKKLGNNWFVQYFSSISSEFYLIHHVVIIYSGIFGWRIFPGREIHWMVSVFIMFTGSIFLSALYKELIKIIVAIPLSQPRKSPQYGTYRAL